jgi:D-sedoheptulose 7-phosphate isomerase
MAAMHAQADSVEQIADVIATNVLAGHTLFTCGNGGSAADASICRRAEWSLPWQSPRIACAITQYRRPRSSPASLMISAMMQSFSPTRSSRAGGRFGVCAEHQWQLGEYLAVLESARAKGVTTIAMLGKGGGTAAGRADYRNRRAF